MLSYKLRGDARRAQIVLKGVLDQGTGSALKPLLVKAARLHVVFDCKDILAVNSIGYRQWIEFLKELGKSSTFDIENCPPSFLDFANLLPKTSFADHIASFLVPFRCRACERETVRSFEVDAVEPTDASFAEVLCPHCNGIARPLTTPSDCLGFKLVES